jgi:hypothetical protein
MLDAFIAILAAIPTLYLAHIGVSVSLKPPRKSDDVTRKDVRFRVYAAAAMSLFFIGVQAFRSSRIIDALFREERSRVDASVVLDRVAGPRDNFHIATGQPFSVNIFFKSTHNTAKNVQVFPFALIEDGQVTDSQSDLAWQYAWAEFRRHDSDKPPDIDVPEGKTMWTSSTMPPLAASDAEGLIAGTRRLYLIQLVRWRNSSGSVSTRTFCQTLIHAEQVNLSQTGEFINCKTASPY